MTTTFGFASRSISIELGEHGNLPGRRSTLATPRIGIDRADDRRRRHAGERREMQRVSRIAQVRSPRRGNGSYRLVDR